MNEALLITSLIAGMFSVLAPCVIGILPVLMARSIDTTANRRSPWWVIGGLAASIFFFSILLKSTTLLIGVPDGVWRGVSGGIILLFGIFMLWPAIWETIALRSGFAIKSQRLMGEANKMTGRIGDFVLGASLGPVFSACSPTYLVIVATILPAAPVEGIIYLLAYILGLVAMIALVLAGGKRIVRRLNWGVENTRIAQKFIAVLLIAIGLMVITGFDKMLLTWFVSNGWFDWQVELERSLSL